MSISPSALKNVLLIGFLLATAGCGGRAFEPEFRDVAEPERSQVIDALDTIEKRHIKPVVVGVSDSPEMLFAWDLDQAKMIWSRPVKALSMPIVAGDLVVIHEADGIVARHLSDGEEAFELDDQARLVGADGDGDITVISLDLGAQSKSRGILVGAQGGEKKWTNDLKLPVGVPAVANGLVVVPWARQRISLLDAITGEEQTRFSIRDTVSGQAFVYGNKVFAGQLVVFPVDKQIEAGTKENSRNYKPLDRSYPGQPPFMWDGYEPVPPPSDPQWRVRLLWRPKVGKDSVGLEDDNLYFLYHRFVFALAPDDDKLKWIYQSASDVVGAAVRPGSVMLVAEGGELTLLDAQTGLKTWETHMGISGIAAACVQPGSYKKEATTEVEPKPLLSQIDDAAGIDDKRLAEGSGFAVRFLKDFPEASVTGQIVKICIDREGSLPVQFEACKALEGRTSGPDHISEALKIRASFLKGTFAPPSGALAQAAGNMGIREAVPNIVSHLADPATPVSELGGIFEGLGKLGGQPAKDAIDKFLRLYHAESDNKQLIAALGLAAQALATLDNPAARPTFDYIVGDPFTSPELRARVKGIVAAFDASASKENPEEESKEKSIEESKEKSIEKPNNPLNNPK